MPESLHQSSGYGSLLSTDPSPKATTINSHDLTDISKVSKTGKCLVDFLSEVKRTSKHSFQLYILLVKNKETMQNYIQVCLIKILLICKQCLKSHFLYEFFRLKVHLKNVSFEEFTNFVAFKLQETTRQRMERISKM